MPLGAARLSFFHQPVTVVAEAEVIRKKLGVGANNSAQVDTAQSKFGGASLLTNRTNPDYLSVQNDANSLDMGSGDWTVEFFMRPTSLPGGGAYHFIYDSRITGAGSQISIGLTNSKVFFFTTNAFRITGATTLSLNTMYHVAVVKSGSTTTLYLDGTSDGTYSDSNTYDARDDVRIGANFNGANGFTGNIDEFRVSNSARYTASFTPTTTPFVNDDNTKLLLHMNGTDASTFFEDDNGTIGRQPHYITANGNAQIDTAQYNFGGSSADFDGSTSYLTNDDNWDVTDNWTLEFFIRTDSVSGQYPAIFYFGNQNTSKGWAIEEAPGGNLSFISSNDGSSGMSVRMTATSALTASTWHHVAIVLQGTSGEMYVDGTSVATGTVDPIAGDSSSVLRIGGGQGGLSSGNFGGNTSIVWYSGHLDEIRISDKARYTSAFTAPTTPFKNDANTLLLLHMDGIDGSNNFADDAGGRSQVALQALGNAQIDTANSQFGGSSLLLDGTGDALTTGTASDTNSPFYHMKGPWTVELWFNPVTDTGSASAYLLTDRSGGYGNYNMQLIYRNLDNKVQMGWNAYNGSDPTQGLGGGSPLSAAVTNNTWNHVAMVYDGTQTSTYLNGTRFQNNTMTYDNLEMNATGQWGIGGDIDDAALPFNQGGNGYIDEVRISSVARYDASESTLVVPEEPFVNDDDTMLLVHCNGTDGDTDFRDDNGHYNVGRTGKSLLPVNNTQISTAQAKFGRSSGYWDGTGDYLVLKGSRGSDFSGDFTIECWYYPTSVGSNDKIFDLRGINSAHAYGGTGTFSTSNSLLIDNNSSDFRVFVDGSDRSTASSGTFTVNTWHHVAVQRENGTINAWVDGTRYVDYAGSDDYTAVFIANQAIGANVETSSNVSNLQGYMDEMRISTVARYTNGATITVPTERFTDDSDTHVLCHFEGDNGSTNFVDDVGGRSAVGVHAINGAQVSTAQSEFGGTSLDTTGASSGDYLNVSDDVIYLGDGDYTIEGRVRIENLSSFNGVFQLTPNSSTGLSGTYTGGIAFQLRTSTGNWRYIANATWQEASSGGPVASTWYHFALVRSGTTATLYIDGTSIKTSTDSTDYSSPMYAAIGGIVSTSNTNDGYIDEFRISNTARYTSGFTPATEPFQNDANTLLLLHMDGTNGSTVFTDDNGRHKEE